MVIHTETPKLAKARKVVLELLLVTMLAGGHVLLEDFPGKTEGDLYLWVLDHQHYLAAEKGIPLQPPEEAAHVATGKNCFRPVSACMQVPLSKHCEGMLSVALYAD